MILYVTYIYLKDFPQHPTRAYHLAFQRVERLALTNSAQDRLSRCMCLIGITHHRSL